MLGCFRLPSIVAFLLLTLASPTRAQVADADERARLHFQSGTAYFDAGDYEAALREFQSAYDLSHRVGLLYNVYLSHERLGNLSQAAANLERYLADEELEDSRRAVLSQRLDNIRRRAETEEAEAAAAAAATTATSTTTTTDGTGVDEGTGETPPDRGTVEPPPDEPIEVSGDTTDARPPDGDAYEASESSSGWGPNSAALVSYAVAGAGAVTWAVFGILAATENSSLINECGDVCSDEQVSSLGTYNVVADIGFAVTVAAAALGTFLWLFLGSDDDESSASLAPFFGPNAGGVLAQGSL